MQIQKNITIRQEIFDMTRHYKRFKVSKEARIVSYNPNINRNCENKEWSVEIRYCQYSEHHSTVIGNLTLSDLYRLKRVVNRAIKIVKDPKRHNPTKLW